MTRTLNRRAPSKPRLLCPGAAAVRAELKEIRQLRSWKTSRMVSRSAHALTDPFRRS